MKYSSLRDLGVRAGRVHRARCTVHSEDSQKKVPFFPLRFLRALGVSVVISFFFSSPLRAEVRPSLPGVPYAFTPSLGKARLLVLLINFPNQTPLFSPDQFQALFFSRGTSPTGSLADYLAENSYGKLIVEGEVRGWYQAKEPEAYYAGNAFGHKPTLYPRSMARLVEEAVAQAEAEGVDFSACDNNGDGHVDGLVVIHQGPGGDVTNRPDNLWTTMDYISRGRGAALQVDGVVVDRFLIFEEYYQPDRILPVGIVAHEFGHALGLPDFYQHGGRLALAGVYDLMSAGVWGGGDATRPFQLSAYSKAELGWLEPKVITGRRQVALAPLETQAEAARLNTPRPGEYFLLEYRAQVGFDQNLPGEGLLIWHVDENVITGNDLPCTGCCANHPLLALEQADGRNDLEGGKNRGDAEDFFPGPKQERKLFAQTTGAGGERNRGAHSLTWDCGLSGVRVSDIRLADGKVLFQARDDDPGLFYTDWPWLVLRSVQVEEVRGDGDGRAEPGETVRLYPVFYNQGAKARKLRITAAAPGLDFLGRPLKISKVRPREEFLPGAGLDLEIPADFGPARVKDIHWTIALRKKEIKIERVTPLVIGTPEILVVNGAGPGVAGLYQDLLDKLQEPYELWDLNRRGSPPLARLKEQRTLIWLEPFSGSAAAGLTSERQQLMQQYLAAGGNLLLVAPGLKLAPVFDPEAPFGLSSTLSAQTEGSSRPKADRREPAPGSAEALAKEMLRVRPGAAFGGISQVKGQAGDLISRDQTFAVQDLFGYPSLPVYAEILPGEEAAPVYTDPFGHVVGVRYPAERPGNWKAVTLSFSFEALPLTAQMQALARILDFFRRPVDAPVVDAIRPSAGMRGTSQVKLVLSGLNLRPEMTVDLGEGVQVDEVRAKDSKSLELIIQIDPSAPVGRRDLTLQAPGQEPLVLPRSFTVIP